MDPMYTRSQASSLAETVLHLVHKPAAHLGLSLFWYCIARLRATGSLCCAQHCAIVQDGNHPSRSAGVHLVDHFQMVSLAHLSVQITSF